MIVLAVSIIILYVFICYANYRIIRKFNPAITFLQNLIPVWNIYLLAKLINPAKAVLVTGLLLLTSNNYYEGAFLYFMVLTNFCLKAWLYGNIAKRLGKNIWVHAVLAFFLIPLLITIPIMAFDDSRPSNNAEVDVKTLVS
ncbi:MAG: hypothetical protein H7X79_03010 [Sporomusaceae bacterium]|nr:hypothetical protein [Sporomusaceae bacterium]